MEARNGPTISASECRADADSLVDSLTRALRTSPFVDTSELYTWKGGGGGVVGGGWWVVGGGWWVVRGNW